MGHFKPWGTTMGYPIGVPIGVPLYSGIWTSFWNILISYFIYSVAKAMEPGWSFVKKLDWGKALFSPSWHLKFTPGKPNSYITISVSKLQVPCLALIRVECFRIVIQAHFRENLFYVKLTTFFTAENIKFDTKISKNSESSSNEHEVTLNSFRVFVYISSYLHSKSFAWKRDYIISQKLQTPQT